MARNDRRGAAPDPDLLLRELAPAFDAWRVAEPSAELIAQTLTRARAELRPSVLPPAHAAIPTGFKRELAKLMLAIAPPLAVVVAWNAFVMFQLPEWLAGWLPAWLPEFLAWGLPALYVLAAAALLALVFGTLPFFAHRRAWQRHHEALS